MSKRSMDRVSREVALLTLCVPVWKTGVKVYVCIIIPKSQDKYDYDRIIHSKPRKLTN